MRLPTGASSSMKPPVVLTRPVPEVRPARLPPASKVDVGGETSETPRQWQRGAIAILAWTAIATHLLLRYVRVVERSAADIPLLNAMAI